LGKGKSPNTEGRVAACPPVCVTTPNPSKKKKRKGKEKEKEKES
jgi:hypothetical protein